jgi:hypothetical protein
MAMHPDNMQEVKDDVPVGSWLHVRVKAVTEGQSQTSGREQATVVFAIQEEPYVGKTLVTWPSLEPGNLSYLKKLYAACGYNPGPEGHDPEKIINCELFVKPVEQKKKVEGVPPYQIPEWNLAPIADGKPLK